MNVDWTLLEANGWPLGQQHPQAVSREGLTPLMHAVRFDPRQVPALLRQGARAAAADQDGMTVLMHAAATENEVVRKQSVTLLPLLIEYGAALSQSDHDGWTALFHAVSRGCPWWTKALLDEGANPNVKRVTGNTCLTLLGFHNPDNIDVLGPMLLDAGAQVSPVALPAGLMRMFSSWQAGRDADMLALHLSSDREGRGRRRL
jgi:hypothetical protein